MAEKERLPEWAADLVANVGDKAVRDLVSDFRNYNIAPGPPLPTATPIDAAPVKTGSDTFAHGGSGWCESPSVNSWQKSAGIADVDRLVSAQDQADKIERIAKLAETVRNLQLLKEVEASAKKLEQEKGPAK
jgi:hypothetical protein